MLSAYDVGNNSLVVCMGCLSNCVSKKCNINSFSGFSGLQIENLSSLIVKKIAIRKKKNTLFEFCEWKQHSDL